MQTVRSSDAMLQKKHFGVRKDPYFVTLLVVYFTAFAPMLFCSGIFWDDWVLTGLGLRDYFIFSQKLYAMFFPGFIFMLFIGIKPLFGHWVAFVCYLIPGLLLYKHLRKKKLPC